MSRAPYLTAALASLLLLAICLLDAVNVAAAATFDAPSVRLVDSGAKGFVLEVSVPEPQFRAGHPVLAGYQDSAQGLPVRELLVGLPPSGDVSLDIEVLSAPEVWQGPAPSPRRPPEIQTRTDATYEAGSEEGNAVDQPESLPLASLAGEGFFRGWRLARLQVAPLAYLGEGRWQWTPRLRIVVTFDTPAPSTDTAEPAPFHELVAAMAINGAQATGWLAAAPPVQPTTVYTLPATAWRLDISADGLYRLRVEDLEAAGVPLEGVDPGDIHLVWRNREVALQEVGLDDGNLDPGDALLFYGQKFHGSVQDEKYTDENAYWLSIDEAQPGQRMNSRGVAPSGPASEVAWYTATVHAEENNVYWARWSNQPGTDATWFWERIVAAQPVTRIYALTLADPAPVAYSATLQVEVAARNEHPASPDHHLRLSFNGTPIGENVWDGKIGHIFTLPLTSSLLQPGANQVGITALTDVTVQDIYVNWIQITYRRRMVAQEDTVAWGAPLSGSAHYSLEGFASSDLQLYDLADPLAPVILTGASIAPDGPDWTLSFVDQALPGQPYLAVATSQARDVPSPVRFEPSLDLLSAARGADEIMVVPEPFYTATLPLADHRRAAGLRVEVVRVEDLYALFNGGIVHPQAIRNFLAYAFEHWQPPAPAYLLLVGDGHFNFKGYNPDVYGPATPVRIPPYLDFVDLWQGEVPVDARFGRVVGDDLWPDVAVGRLAANSVQEVEDVVAKILRYEKSRGGDADGRILLVADNVPDLAGDFEAVLDTLATDYVPADVPVAKVYLTDYCGPPTSPPTHCPAATLALTRTWNQGPVMLTYLGHGAIHRWAHEPLMLNTQIDTLQPGHGLPFVLTLNCLDGYWMMPPEYPGYNNPRSIAEWLSMAPDHGSIAGFSPAGLGTTSAEDAIARSMYTALFDAGVRRLGEIALAGQLTPISFPAHLPEVSTLFGDPAGLLNLSRTRIYTPLILRQGMGRR